MENCLRKKKTGTIFWRFLVVDDLLEKVMIYIHTIEKYVVIKNVQWV